MGQDINNQKPEKFSDKYGVLIFIGITIGLVTMMIVSEVVSK